MKRTLSAVRLYIFDPKDTYCAMDTIHGNDFVDKYIALIILAALTSSCAFERFAT